MKVLKSLLLMFVISVCSIVVGCAVVPSSNTSITVNLICGEQVVGDSVTLSTAQYQELSLAEDKSLLCEYVLPQKASVDITLEEKNEIIVLTFLVTAEDKTQAEYTISVLVLSSDVEITVVSVCGKEVEFDSITFTTAEYIQFLDCQDVKSQCEYQLSEGATVEVVIQEYVISFCVTAEDGTENVYQIQLNVLSNDTSLEVKSVNEVEAEENLVVLSAEKWLALAEANDVTSLVDVVVADKAEYSVEFVREESQLEFQITAEDGTQDVKYFAVEVQDVFGKYNDGELGEEDGYVWDNVVGAYVTKEGTNGFSAYYVNETEILANDYYFTADISFPQLVSEGEIVMSAFIRNNKCIRFVVKAVDTTNILVFTDFREDSSFVNYLEVVPQAVYTGPVCMGVIVYGNDVAMTWNGEVVYHRALDGIDNSTLVLNGANKMTSELRNIVVENETLVVKALYQEAMDGYNDPIVGNTTGSTRHLDRFVQNYEEKSVTIDYLNNTAINGTDPVVSFYHNGNPLYGYSWAVTGTLNTVTPSGMSTHLTLSYYQDNNNMVRYIINRNAGSSGVDGVYLRYKNNSSTEVNAGLVTSNKAFEKGANWTATFALVYDAGCCKLYVDGKLIYSYETNFRRANALIEPYQYVKATFSNINTTNDPFEVENLIKELENPTVNNVFETDEVFEQKGLSFVKETEEYANALVKMQGSTEAKTAFYFNARFGILEPKTWGQGEILLKTKSGNGVRFFIEYLSNGEYQTVTERLYNGQYSGWTKIASGANREIDLGVAVYGGKIMLTFGKDVRFEYAFTEAVSLYFGGKDCTVRVKDFIAETDEQKVATYVNGLTEYVYSSSYDSEINNLEVAYANEEKGQMLLIGSSTFTRWKDTYTDVFGVKVKGYLEELKGYRDSDNDQKPDVLNFGFGGSTWTHQLGYFDRIITAYAPSEIVIYCGANDVYEGRSAQETYGDFLTFMQLIRKNYPTIKVHYIHIMPSHNMTSSSAVWERATDLKVLINDYASSNDNFYTIDLYDELSENGAPKQGLWTDNGHLSQAGYDILAQALRSSLGI